MLGKAISIAAQSFEEDCDKGGKPYILHPMRVMMRLRTNDEELMQMAILHDTVEDKDDWTFERLLEEGFSARVLAALDCLTHRKNEPYNDYVKRVATNKDAILVKLQDLKDNLDPLRLKGLEDKDHKRTVKYHTSFKFLENAMENLELLK